MSNLDVKPDKDFTHFQNLVIHLKDGRCIQATIPAFCETEEDLTNIKIMKIEITRPEKLPDGSGFQMINSG